MHNDLKKALNISGKEEEARVHQHMHAVAQRQVIIITYKIIITIKNKICYFGYPSIGNSPLLLKICPAQIVDRLLLEKECHNLIL